MKRAIITGATGAVGIALVQELILNNIEVLVFCREGSSRNNRIPRHPLITVKYCSLNQLASIENTTGKTYDVFYHLAWEGTTGSARNDMYLQNQNVRYALDAVGAASRFGCKVFVGAGSQAEYGRAESKLNADTPTFPENGYGMAKLCAGQMSRGLCEQKGMKHIWTRILSVSGPYDGPNTMIMSTIGKLLNKEVPKLTKGEQQWDYLYSKDAARAMYLIGKNGKHGKVYCIGSGQTKELGDYVRILRDCIDPQLMLGIGEIPYSQKQVMYLCADISELIMDTGFEPEYSFEKGIQETIDWYRRRSAYAKD